uniref:Neurotransmitter-gated ion-channel ligand-binding domain-containing protein n=1 Tax=Oncorhynchus mykiss TaxID=8022 RepID=A0A8C7SUR6_ONCMY
MEDLLLRNLFQGYQRWVRPIQHANDRVTVRFGLKISQLVDVDEKNQLMTTNVWLWQEWLDSNLRSDPEDYGGITSIGAPSEAIRLPDIFEGSLMTKAIAKSNRRITWTPPASYKSACTTDVTFPFDRQKLLHEETGATGWEKLSQIIPTSSKVIPLIGEYLLFIMIFVTLSVIVSVCIQHAPPLLNLLPPHVPLGLLPLPSEACQDALHAGPHRPVPLSRADTGEPRAEALVWGSEGERVDPGRPSFQIVQDWKFVAQVLDRIFLWAFLTVSVLGTILIFALHIFLSTSPQSGPSTPL